MAHHVLRFAAGTDVGRRRKVNEDAAFAGPRLLAVADGMGGHPHGDIASRTAIRTLAGVFAADPAAAPAASAAVPAGAGASAPADAAADTAADLAAGIAAVSARLDELGRDDPEMSGMGTALTAMAWDGSGFDVAHVGDSRVYLLRAGELHRLTRDHTTVQALADGGKLAEAESGRRPGGSGAGQGAAQRRRRRTGLLPARGRARRPLPDLLRRSRRSRRPRGRPRDAGPGGEPGGGRHAPPRPRRGGRRPGRRHLRRRRRRRGHPGGAPRAADDRRRPRTGPVRPPRRPRPPRPAHPPPAPHPPPGRGRPQVD